MIRKALMAIGSLRKSRAAVPLKRLYWRCVFEVPAWLIGVCRFGLRKREVVVFAPDFPTIGSQYRIVCLLNRYDICPSSHAGAHSLTIHYQLETFGLSRSSPEAVNGRWTDQSKSHLDRLHHRVFGYSLGVDPLSHAGPGVVKSERQAANDGRLAMFPIRRKEPGNVYQRFIDNVTDDGLCQDISVQVLGMCIPHVRLDYRPADERRFKKDQLMLTQVVEPGEALTGLEQRQILQLARDLGMEVGKFEFLRDRHDGRIYAVDANSEPPFPLAEAYFPTIEYWRIAIDIATMFRRELVDRHTARFGTLVSPDNTTTRVN